MPNVRYSRIIAAPATRVWEVVGDFGSLPSWFPFVTASELEPAGGQRMVGALRTNHIDDGTTVVERLVALSDRKRRVTYDVVGGDAPVRNYTATITVHEISDEDSSLVTWAASFDAIGEADPIIDWVRNGIFRDCLEELDRVLRVAAPA